MDIPLIEMNSSFKKYEKSLHTIYERLGDEQSKFIYKNRINYSITGDDIYLQNIINHTIRNRIEWKQIRQKLLECSMQSKIVIYGAGIWGHILWEETKDIIDWALCIDMIPKGKNFPIRLIDFTDFVRCYQGEYVVLSSYKNHASMYQKLLENHIPVERIVDVGQIINSLTEGGAYFDLKNLSPVMKSEVFVDGGCYDGFTTKAFFQWAKKGGYAYCFEIDKRNIETIKKNLPEGNYEIIPKALWSKQKQLSLSANGSFAASVMDIEQENNVCIEADTIDALLYDKKVTYIKMDIEGAELEALQGAKKVIQEQSPRLAISIYHKPCDIFVIPSLLYEYNKNYKFYLRHYSFSWYDSVLYALIEKKGAT